MGLFRADLYGELEHRPDHVHHNRERQSYVAGILSKLSRATGTHDHQLDDSLAKGGVDVHRKSFPGRASKGVWEVVVD